MPKGSIGDRRPADTVGRIVTVARIAAGEDEDIDRKQPAKRKGGLANAKARLEVLTSSESDKIARVTANARWK